MYPAQHQRKGHRAGDQRPPCEQHVREPPEPVAPEDEALRSQFITCAACRAKEVAQHVAPGYFWPRESTNHANPIPRHMATCREALGKYRNGLYGNNLRDVYAFDRKERKGGCRQV